MAISLCGIAFVGRADGFSQSIGMLMVARGMFQNFYRAMSYRSGWLDGRGALPERSAQARRGEGTSATWEAEEMIRDAQAVQR